jgi:hypothetical protein
LEDLIEKGNLEDIELDESIILKWICRKWTGVVFG